MKRRPIAVYVVLVMLTNGVFAQSSVPESELAQVSLIETSGEIVTLRVEGASELLNFTDRPSEITAKLLRPALVDPEVNPAETFVTYTESATAAEAMVALRVGDDEMILRVPKDAAGAPLVSEGILEVNGISFPMNQSLEGELPVADPAQFSGGIEALGRALGTIAGPIGDGGGGSVSASSAGCAAACIGCIYQTYKWVRTFAALAACPGSGGLGCAAWAAADHIVATLASGMACGVCADCSSQPGGGGQTVNCPPMTFQCGVNMCCPECLPGTHQCGTQCCLDVVCPPGMHECGTNMCCPGTH